MYNQVFTSAQAEPETIKLDDRVTRYDDNNYCRFMIFKTTIVSESDDFYTVAFKAFEILIFFWINSFYYLWFLFDHKSACSQNDFAHLKE